MNTKIKTCLVTNALVTSLLGSTVEAVGPSETRPNVVRRGRRRPFPPIHITDEVDAIEEHSVAKRNGLSAPPLMTRRKRRQLQVNQTDTQTNETELDIIIEQAKLGDDSNARLRNDLVWSAYYDRNSYPWEYAWEGDAKENRTGVPVEIDINFHRVYSVDTVNPSLDLIVWFRLTWVDPRLTWDPAEYGNHTKTWFWIDSGGAGGETSEIWTPDIELWNLEEGLANSLEDAYAVVKYDGSVFWSRPGHLRPACKYEGLEKFPFDELSCTIELGSWVYSGMYMTLSKGGGHQLGFSVGGSETAGESYNEFSFIEENPIDCEVYVYNTAIWDNTYVYDQWGNLPDTKWPVMLYTVRLERSWQPYARGYIYSQILLILIGFSAFWLPPSCGERMGLSITALLASIASDIVIAGNLPQAKELTWFQQFSIMNSMFVFLALIESVVVLYFFYSKSETIVPKWYTYLKEWKVFQRTQRRSSELVSETAESIRRKTVNFKDIMFHSRQSNGKDHRDRSDEEDDDFDDDFVPEELPEMQSRTRPTATFESALGASVMRDADDFLNEQELENNLRWKEYAAIVDDFSRFWFPLTYAIAVACILARAK